MSEAHMTVPAQTYHSANVNGASARSDVQQVLLLFGVLLFGFYLFLLLVPNGEHIFLRDPDVYWHVAAGKRIWQTGSLPYFDDLSHTFQGRPWIAKEWLSELIFYGAYALAGWRGVVLLSACAASLTFALLFLILGRTMRLSIAIGVTTVAFLFSGGHFNARPLILADPLIVLWVAGLVHAVENRTSPNLLLLPMMTLWANLHGSFTFGLAIGAGLAVEAFFESPPDQRLPTARRWALFLFAALAFACITPYAYRSSLVTFQVFVGNDSLRFVQDWRPATLHMLGINELTIFGLLFLSLYYGMKLSFWRLILVLAVVYLMFKHIRFAGLFALTSPLLLAHPLAKQFPFLSLTNQINTESYLFENIVRVSRRLIISACMLIIAGVITFGSLGPFMTPEANISPAGAVDYIVRNRLPGKIYNSYNFGGYLIFRGIKTFIDGRTDQLFYQDNFIVRLHDIIDNHPKLLSSYLNEYGIGIALVEHNSIEAQELERSENWEKIYSDNVSELFQNQNRVHSTQT